MLQKINQILPSRVLQPRRCRIVMVYDFVVSIKHSNPCPYSLRDLEGSYVVHTSGRDRAKQGNCYCSGTRARGLLSTYGRDYTKTAAPRHAEEINAVHPHPADGGGILGDVKQDLCHLRCHVGLIYSITIYFLSYFLQFKARGRGTRLPPCCRGSAAVSAARGWSCRVYFFGLFR